MDKILAFSGAKIQLLRDLIRLANLILEKRKSIGQGGFFAALQINETLLDTELLVSYIRKLAAAAETISKATAVSKDSELGKILKRELEHVHIKMDSAIEKDPDEHDRKAAFESYLTEPVRQAELDGKFAASYTGKLASAADAILKSTDDPTRLEEATKDEPAKIQRDMDEEVELALNEAHTQYQREHINEERETSAGEEQSVSATPPEEPDAETQEHIEEREALGDEKSESATPPAAVPLIETQGREEKEFLQKMEEVHRREDEAKIRTDALNPPKKNIF